MPTLAPPVDRSGLRLSEVARHVVIPEGIVDSLWFDVAEQCEEFGDTFDAWQDGLGQAMLGLRVDGMFAATVGGITLSIPRQVAKTFIVMRIVVALCTLFPNLTVLWTAHRTRTATNTFQKMKSFVLRPNVRGYLRAGSNQGTAIRDANGEQEIPFANGSRILFGAREQGFGRGFDEVDVEVFDEAQILTERALEDMVAATNQSRFRHGALLFYMGTPPRPQDPGEAFSLRRADALLSKQAVEGIDFGPPVESGDSLYVECSADANVGRPDGPSLDDQHQIEKANASYPHRTPPVSIKRLRKNLPSDEGWRREGLGVWDDVNALTAPSIDWPKWSALASPAPDSGRVAYAVKFSADGSRVAIGAAVQPENGVPHVELVKVADMAAGTSWLVDWLSVPYLRLDEDGAAVEMPARWRTCSRITIDGAAGAGALVNALRKAKVPERVLHTPSVPEVISAHSMIAESIRAGTLSHFPEKNLDDAVRGAGKRPIGRTGGWGWSPLSPDVDVTPLDAVTLALHALTTGKRGSSGRTGESTRRATVT